MRESYPNREYEGETRGEGVVHAARRDPWDAPSIACRLIEDLSNFYSVDDKKPVTCLQCVAKL